jgi:hypothetical protein
MNPFLLVLRVRRRETYNRSHHYPCWEAEHPSKQDINTKSCSNPEHNEVPRMCPQVIIYE